MMELGLISAAKVVHFVFAESLTFLFTQQVIIFFLYPTVYS